MEIKEIIKLCEARLGVAPEKVERLAGAGSSRRYYRLYFSPGIILFEKPDGQPLQTAIATVGDDVRENKAFCELDKVFRSSETFGNSCDSVSVPEIYCHSDNYSVYVQEDLGNTSLLDIIYKDKQPVDLIARVLRGLLDIQLTPLREWMNRVFTRPFDEMRVLGDFNYFKYCFLKPSGIVFDEDKLNTEIVSLAKRICSYDKALDGFMYRDFQSRNVMVTHGNPVFIDFQGGMEGPMLYDVISFLWQAKAGFSSKLRNEMLDLYIARLCTLRSLDFDYVKGLVDSFVLLRTLQVLGAYGFRGLIERKAHFIESIPLALKNLAEVLAKGVIDDCPELRRCCEELVNLRRFNPEPHNGLLVEVWSFSFKKGYPENLTGNGGGFVFDCRGMHNPGRYEEYRTLTGNDREVIDFLESRGEVQHFMKHVAALVMPSVDTYLRRGFSDLQVAFGCTGGRHRSVYCANEMSRLLREHYPDLSIKLIHREQGTEIMY